MVKKVCRECGKTFYTRNGNVNCPTCVDKMLSEFTGREEREQRDVEFYYNLDANSRPKTRKKPAIYKAVKEADKLGISYGEYMARKRGRR